MISPRREDPSPHREDETGAHPQVPGAGINRPDQLGAGGQAGVVSDKAKDDSEFRLA